MSVRKLRSRLSRTSLWPVTKPRWWAKQKLAGESRYYGDGGTIHGTPYLHVETCKGKVVAVWFRCQILPFQQVEVGPQRAKEMGSMEHLPKVTGVEVRD